MNNETNRVEFELIQVEPNYIQNVSLFIKERTLFIIGRNETLGKKIFFINDFYPRFFVETNEIDIRPDINIGSTINEEYENKIHKIKEGNYRNLGGKKKLTKIYLNKTSNVEEIRSLFNKTYEGNIRFTEVFKRKKKIKGKFYVPEFVFTFKPRIKKYNGIEVIKLKHKEISGGELKF